MKPRVVYVIGAGLSAGLGFPTIHNLLPKMWPRIQKSGFSDDLSDVIRFHHPDFNELRADSYPDIEQLLSEMSANAQLFDSSRPATGNFTSAILEERRKALLLELASWFHDLKEKALKRPPDWLADLVSSMKSDEAQIVSFNWDLVLDQLLFGEGLTKSAYGFGKRSVGPRLIKPHGSLNWFEKQTGGYLSQEKRLSLIGRGRSEILAFRPYRAPKSKRRTYLPLIIPPVYQKEFRGAAFRQLWQETVSTLSTASEVRFLGYSLPAADFHARFILRCGFHNQEFGELQANGNRARPTGRAEVTIVDPASEGPKRVEDAVGWACHRFVGTVAEWVETADQIKAPLNKS